MAVCGTCKAETKRVRSRWDEKGVQLPDECPNCAPSSFEKFTAPSEKKIWMGYEAHPNEYVKSEDGGFDRKPEYRAEQEAKLALPATDEQEAQARAAAKKRIERRTEPMTPAEHLSAIAKAKKIADLLQEAAKEGTDIIH